jgi:EAL and modified HD-GYP domain-containing signal transduction protein
MQQDIFIARQPIVDRKENLVAFELLFRSAHSSTESGVLDDTHATAQVLVNAFGEMGIADVLGAHRGFINLNAEILHSDLIELLPKQQVMLELLETITIDAAIIARCHELKAKGFSLALDDVVELTDDIKPLLSIVEVVKLDLMLIDPARLPVLLKELKRYPVKLLAEKVEDHEHAKRYMEMGFDLFQGYHFARPEMLTGKRSDPSKMALIRLLSMLLEEAEIDEIEEAFKEHADLTYNLMRMVNSVGTGLTTKISSLKHGLLVLGRQPLRRWVQLLLYASSKGNITASPLMQLAATRGKMLELVAMRECPGDRDYADRAFMVGMLSLLDTLMGEPLQEILVRMSLQEDVEIALLKHQGSLGELLTLCEKIETGDLDAIQEMLHARPGFSVDMLNKAQLEALWWANNIVL